MVAYALLAGALAVGLAGCGKFVDTQIDMYHGLQGGAIAQQRPPAPGIDDPYPNLGSVPPRPAAPDVPAQQRIADRLATQRDAAEADAARSPLVASAAPPRPATPAKPPAPPDPNANRVVVDAASAPAPPRTPAPAPVPAAPAVNEGSPVPDLGSVPAVPAAVISGPVPALAAAPPASPGAVGIDIPHPGPAPDPPAAAAPPAAPANTVLVVFTPGSATLPPSAPLNLRRFALAHKGVPVTITGHGGDVLPGADAQARALDLALRRAQAIADSLNSAGIPASNLRLRGDAAGQGGAATL